MSALVELSVEPLERLLERGQEEIAEGALPSEAAALVLREMEPDGDAAMHLMRLGLTRLLNAAVHDDNRDGGGKASVEPATEDYRRQFQLVGPTPRERRDVLLRLYAGADGQMRALLEFTLADCQRLRDRALGQVKGWEAIERSMGVAIGLMNTHEVEVVSKLPAKALATLRTVVAEEAVEEAE